MNAHRARHVKGVRHGAYCACFFIQHYTIDIAMLVITVNPHEFMQRSIRVADDERRIRG